MDDATVELIRETIRHTVNGKIDALVTKFDGHIEDQRKEAEKQSKTMERILPVVEAYENTQRAGNFLVKSAGAFATIGGAYIVLKQIFPNLPSLW